MNPAAPDSTNPARFAGRVAVVTGGGDGIGRATALRFAAEGAAVHVVDVRADAAAASAAQISDAGGVASWTAADVADADACARSVGAARHTHGRIDVLANIAGVGSMGRTELVTPAEWRRVLSVNLDGAFFMCLAVLPSLLETHGCIVNMSSAAGLRGQPYTVAYCASKGGLELLTKSMAVEYRGRIRVNAVCPGGVDTKLASGFDFSELDPAVLAPLFRVTDLIAPADIATAVLYLASDDAAAINGASLSVDHGMVAM